MFGIFLLIMGVGLRERARRPEIIVELVGCLGKVQPGPHMGGILADCLFKVICRGLVVLLQQTAGAQGKIDLGVVVTLGIGLLARRRRFPAVPEGRQLRYGPVVLLIIDQRPGLVQDDPHGQRQISPVGLSRYPRGPEGQYRQD